MFDNGEQDFDKWNCVETCIKIEDLELVENYELTNEEIAKDLPSDELWWCIVEDGFIKNLKGEKKTKFLMTMILKNFNKLIKKSQPIFWLRFFLFW